MTAEELARIEGLWNARDEGLFSQQVETKGQLLATVPALIALARRALELESALHHIDKRCFGTATALYADRGQHPDDMQSENEDLSADGLLAWAKELGWEGL